MKPRMTPRLDQEKAIREVLAHKRHLCKGEVGSGKTLVGVESAIRAGSKVVQIVAPLNTERGWRNTFARQGSDLPFRRVKGTSEKDKNLQGLIMGEPGIYFMAWETFRVNAWWHKFPIDFTILDEVHRQQNRNSATFAAVKSLRSEYRLSLSATPWGNKVEGAWAVLAGLWPDIYLPGGFWKWATLHLTRDANAFSEYALGGEQRPGEIWAKVPSKSFFKSPYQEKPTLHAVEVKLTAAQLRNYEKLEKDAYVWLEENLLATNLPATKYLRLMESTLAVLSVKQEWRPVPDDPEYETKGEVRFGKDVPEEEGKKYQADKLYELVDVTYIKDDAKSTKADAMLEVLADLSAGGTTPPVLVFTHSEKFATFFTKRLQSKGYRARRFVGGMSDRERNWKLENFAKEFEILVCTIPTVGEGTDGLQDVCEIEFWASVSESNILNEQARGRLSRPGQKNKVQRYTFFAEGTVETTKQLPRIQRDSLVLESSFQEIETERIAA